MTKTPYLFLCALLLAGTSLSAKTPKVKPSKEQAQKQLVALKQKIKKTRRSLVANKKRYNLAVNQLQQIEKNVALASSELRHVKIELANSASKLERLQKKQKKLDILKIKQQQVLGNQFRSAYGSGDEEYLKLILNQEDPQELSRMLGYFSYLNKARTHQIKLLTETLIQIKNTSSDIEFENKNLKVLLKQHKKKISQLAKLQKKQKRITSRWQLRVKSTHKKLDNFKANEKELQTIIDTVRKAIEVFMSGESLQGLSRLKKKLKWPVYGKIIKKFGRRRNNSSLRWHGVFIQSKQGRAVHAIRSGRVVFSDWLRGYGLLLILDHGKKYLTLYGHNQALLKHTGDWVEPGEVISLVGNTGGQEKMGLYFEMRHNNKPVNPAIWCR